MQGQGADTLETRESPKTSPSSVGQSIPNPMVKRPRLGEKAQDSTGERGISRVTLPGTGVLFSCDAGVLRCLSRLLWGLEVVIREDHLHSTKQDSHKLFLTGGACCL